VVESNNGLAITRVGSQLLKTMGEYDVNTRIGILIRPEDIILSKDAIKTTARNIIKAKVDDIKETSTSGMADVLLKTDWLRLRCRITMEARNELSIMKDDQVYAIFKATSPQVVREES
jgi:molybdate transport system regulatory protein